MRLHGRAQRHGVVQTGLDVAGAVRRGAVVFGHAQLDRLQAALEVRADGRDQDAERVLGSRSHADDLAGADHERAHVQRGAGAKRRHPRSVRLHNFLNGLDEAILRKARHLKTLSGIEHAACIHVRTEANDGTLFGGVSLQTLEHFLAIMENAGALGKMQVVVGGQTALVPLAILPMSFVAVVGLMVAEIKAAPVKILLLDHRDAPS